jgi:pimeloyl-ACP methyl ester carboxylesterase
MGHIEERFVDVDGVRTLVREVSGEGCPAVFVHGNPNHSGMWTEFLERIPGAAVAFDLPGFGRSDRPAADDFDCSMHAYGAFVGRLLERLGIERYRLVLHDWGVVALLAAMAAPERLERLVLIDCVPLLPGYRWHWVARIWRRRGAGELFNALATKPGARLALRQARPGLRPMPPGFVDDIWRYQDRGMKRAVLRLYRSADPGALAAAGGRLDRLRCPALVVWGRRDPYLPARLGRAYAERLPSGELLELDGAGHWPWLDRPDVLARVVDYVSQAPKRPATPT